MEFLDEMPAEENQKTVKGKVKPNTIKNPKPTDGFDIEIGTLIFTMGDVDLEIKDVKVRDMEEFKKFIFEVMDS